MRIVIAEDHTMLRAGLVSLLEASGHTIEAEAGDEPALRAAFDGWDADVAIVDIRLPPTNTDEGLRAVLDARRTTPGLPVMLFSQYVEQLYVRELLTDRAGGIGYLLKDRVSHPRQFLDALTQVAHGGTVLDPTVIDAMLTRSERQRPLDALTPRERDVLRLVAEGRSNAAIGAALHLSDSATTKHITSIFDKLALPPSSEDNRRVLAVLSYLGA
ncbi:MAG: LuxR C-terminal-related transcriptional regulator [Pseudoclavibacter sp.]